MTNVSVFPAVREALSYWDLLKNLTQRELRGRSRSGRQVLV